RSELVLVVMLEVAERLVPSLDACRIDLVEGLLTLSRPAPVQHRRVEWSHFLDRVGQALRLPLQVFVQPPVSLPPRLRVILPALFPEVLADRRVGVEPLGPLCLCACSQ